MLLFFITLLLLAIGFGTFIFLIIRISPQWRSDEKIIDAIQSSFSKSGWIISRSSDVGQLPIAEMPNTTVEIYREMRQPWSHESYSTATNRSVIRNPRVVRFRFWKPKHWIASCMVSIPSKSFKQQPPPSEYKVSIEIDRTTIVRLPSSSDLPRDQANFLRAVNKSIRDINLPPRLLPVVVEISRVDASLIFGSLPRSDEDTAIIKSFCDVFYSELSHL
jgi:hypothetical protein